MSKSKTVTLRKNRILAFQVRLQVRFNGPLMTGSYRRDVLDHSCSGEPNVFKSSQSRGEIRGIFDISKKNLQSSAVFYGCVYSLTIDTMQLQELAGEGICN